MKQKSDWKRITLLRKTSFKKEIKILAGYKRQPGNNSESHKLSGQGPSNRANRRSGYYEPHIIKGRAIGVRFECVAQTSPERSTLL
jgi:hypothetical protein